MLKDAETLPLFQWNSRKKLNIVVHPICISCLNSRQGLGSRPGSRLNLNNSVILASVTPEVSQKPPHFSLRLNSEPRRPRHSLLSAFPRSIDSVGGPQIGLDSGRIPARGESRRADVFAGGADSCRRDGGAQICPNFQGHLRGATSERNAGVVSTRDAPEERPRRSRVKRRKLSVVW